MRITPYYEQKGIKNPFYVLSPSVVNNVVRELKKQGDEYKNVKANDILFKNVEPNQLNGSVIYKATPSSSKVFQITDMHIGKSLFSPVKHDVPGEWFSGPF